MDIHFFQYFRRDVDVVGAFLRFDTSLHIEDHLMIECANWPINRHLLLYLHLYYYLSSLSILILDRIGFIATQILAEIDT